MAGSNRRFAIAAVLLPLLFLVISGVARANDIFVNTTDGESPAAPLCSLPDAITAHNLEIPINGCNAGSGLDTIFFDVTGTILIDETLEVTNGILTIQGPLFGCSGVGPCGITVDGGGTIQIMQVDALTLVGLFNLTFADGSANNFTGGGAVSSNGNLLQVVDSTFLNNTAHGPDATDGGRGGAISQVSNGEVEIINSTFVGNTAVPGTTSGDSFGGAIYSTASSSLTRLDITNSTFSGNGASKGGVYHTMDNHPELKGDILANSTSGKNCGALKPIDKGFNISDDVGCSFSGTSVNSTNPQLDPDGLENNGGPTATIDLQPTSPAINRIPVPCTDQETPTPQPLGTDQRLFARPDPAQRNFCDSGALEFGALAPYVLNNERVQVARSTSSSNADKVNIGITFTSNGDDSCDLGPLGDEDALHFGFGLALVQGTCASLPNSGLFLNLFPFVIHTVNHEEYGTLFQSFGSETVSARLLALPTPPTACGEWVLNLEVSGLNTPALGLGGGNPFALLISDFTDAEGCFDITNAVVGTQAPPPPPGGHRRRVRR